MDYHTYTVASHQQYVDMRAAMDDALESAVLDAEHDIERAMLELKPVPTVVAGKLGDALPYVVALDVICDCIVDNDHPITSALISLVESHAGNQVRRLIAEEHAKQYAKKVAQLRIKARGEDY